MAEIAHRLGRKALAEVAVAAKPDTILRWFRKLVARKFDGSACRQSVGRPRVENTIEALIVRMAQENPSWGQATQLCDQQIHHIIGVIFANSNTLRRR